MKLIKVSGIFDNDSYWAKRYFTDEEKEEHNKVDAEYKKYIDEYVSLHDKKNKNEHDFKWREKVRVLEEKMKEFDSILTKIKEPVIKRMNLERTKIDEEQRLRKEKVDKVFEKCKNDVSFQREIEEALKKWPRTYDPKLSGYLLQNGEMLNFSYESYQRDMDHREIASIHEDFESGTDGMRQFQWATGAIRMHKFGDGSGYSFDWVREPTFSQKRKILEIVEDKEVRINDKGTDYNFESSWELQKHFGWY